MNKFKNMESYKSGGQPCWPCVAAKMKAGGESDWMGAIKSTGQCTGANYYNPAKCNGRAKAFATRVRAGGDLHKAAFGGEAPMNMAEEVGQNRINIVKDYAQNAAVNAITAQTEMEAGLMPTPDIYEQGGQKNIFGMKTTEDPNLALYGDVMYNANKDRKDFQNNLKGFAIDTAQNIDFNKRYNTMYGPESKTITKSNLNRKQLRQDIRSDNTELAAGAEAFKTDWKNTQKNNRKAGRNIFFDKMNPFTPNPEKPIQFTNLGPQNRTDWTNNYLQDPTKQNYIKFGGDINPINNDNMNYFNTGGSSPQQPGPGYIYKGQDTGMTQQEFYDYQLKTEGPFRFEGGNTGMSEAEFLDKQKQGAFDYNSPKEMINTNRGFDYNSPEQVMNKMKHGGPYHDDMGLGTDANGNIIPIANFADNAIPDYTDYSFPSIQMPEPYIVDYQGGLGQSLASSGLYETYTPSYGYNTDGTKYVRDQQKFVPTSAMQPIQENRAVNATNVQENVEMHNKNIAIQKELDELKKANAESERKKKEEEEKNNKKTTNKSNNKKNTNKTSTVPTTTANTVDNALKGNVPATNTKNTSTTTNTTRGNVTNDGTQGGTNTSGNVTQSNIYAPGTQIGYAGVPYAGGNRLHPGMRVKNNYIPGGYGVNPVMYNAEKTYLDSYKNKQRQGGLASLIGGNKSKTKMKFSHNFRDQYPGTPVTNPQQNPNAPTFNNYNPNQGFPDWDKDGIPDTIDRDVPPQQIGPNLNPFPNTTAGQTIKGTTPADATTTTTPIVAGETINPTTGTAYTEEEANIALQEQIQNDPDLQGEETPIIEDVTTDEVIDNGGDTDGDGHLSEDEKQAIVDKEKGSVIISSEEEIDDIVKNENSPNTTGNNKNVLSTEEETTTEVDDLTEELNTGNDFDPSMLQNTSMLNAEEIEGAENTVTRDPGQLTADLIDGNVYNKAYNKPEAAYLLNKNTGDAAPYLDQDDAINNALQSADNVNTLAEEDGFITQADANALSNAPKGSYDWHNQQQETYVQSPNNVNPNPLNVNPQGSGNIGESLSNEQYMELVSPKKFGGPTVPEDKPQPADSTRIPRPTVPRPIQQFNPGGETNVQLADLHTRLKNLEAEKNNIKSLITRQGFNSGKDPLSTMNGGMPPQARYGGHFEPGGESGVTNWDKDGDGIPDLVQAPGTSPAVDHGTEGDWAQTTVKTKEKSRGLLDNSQWLGTGLQVATQGITNAFNADDRKAAEDKMIDMTVGAPFEAVQGTDGKYFTNDQQYYDPKGQEYPVQFGTYTKYGGATPMFKQGGEYYLTDEEIAQIESMGGEVEFLD